jgi:hypothetical protein
MTETKDFLGSSLIINSGISILIMKTVSAMLDVGHLVHSRWAHVLSIPLGNLLGPCLP